MQKRHETTSVKVVNSNSKKVVAEAQIDNETGEIIDGKVEEKTEPSVTKTYAFELVELRMKKAQWEMHALLSATLNQIYKNYKLTLVVNLKPVDEKIELALRRMEKQQTTIDGSNEAQAEYNALLRSREELIENCPNIELFASVLSSKYPCGETFIVFQISPEIINELNDHRHYMENYDLQMSPEVFC